MVTIEIRVFRFQTRLVKVVFPGGHQIIVGGRLVSVTCNGVTTPHPELPAYRVEDFPVSFTDWSDGRYPDVHVYMAKASGNLREVSCVRASTLLLNAVDADEVRTWIRGGGK